MKCGSDPGRIQTTGMRTILGCTCDTPRTTIKYMLSWIAKSETNIQVVSNINVLSEKQIGYNLATTAIMLYHLPESAGNSAIKVQPVDSQELIDYRVEANDAVV